MLVTSEGGVSLHQIIDADHPKSEVNVKDSKTPRRSCEKVDQFSIDAPTRVAR